MGAAGQIFGRVACGVVLALAVGAATARAADPPSTDASDLTSLSLEDLMNLEVTSVSKHRQRLGEAPAAVTVITQDDIARSGLQSIPELLRLAPGLDVARIDASQWAISSRGFNDLFANKMLVLMDGRTLYTPLFSGVFWDMEDYVVQDLDRIEVVRGPGATLWGSNAVNGVINIESKSARDTQGWLVDARGGNEQDFGSVRYGGKLDDRTYFRAFTKYRYFDDFPLDGAEANDGWQSLLGGVRIDRYSTDQDTLTFEASGYGSHNDQSLIIPNLSLPTLHQRQDSSFDASEAYALGRWKHVFSDTSDLALQLYYDHLNRRVWQDNIYSLDAVDLDLQHRFALGDRQEITWGAGFRFTADGTSSSMLAPNVVSFVEPRHRDDYFLSGYVQDDLAVVPDRLHLIVGTKLEQNSYNGFDVQPSGKLLWTPNDRNSLWGSIARAVRTPSRWEQDATLSAFAVPTGTPFPGLVQTAPNAGFQSEELVAYEAGYRVKPTKRVSVDINGFFNHYDNLQGAVEGVPTAAAGPPPYLLVPLEIRNDLYGHSYGGELAVNWNVTDRWRLAGSYSWIQIDIHHSRPDLLGQAAFDNQGSPRNQFQVHSYLDVLKNVQLNAGAYYVERLAGVPSNLRLDINVVWRVRDGLELSAGVQNLLDNHHPEFADYRVANVFTEVPRSFYGELTWRY